MRTILLRKTGRKIDIPSSPIYNTTFDQGCISLPLVSPRLPLVASSHVIPGVLVIASRPPSTRVLISTLPPFIPVVILARPATTTSIPCVQRSNATRVRGTNDLNTERKGKDTRKVKTYLANPG